MNNTELMNLGILRADRTMRNNIGGPFGAVVVKDGEIISIASNTVLQDNDPTAHAEMNAIREACKVLGTYDLTGCELYATGYPCPMCLSAIIWSNIKKVYVSGTAKQAEEIGFRDDFIYNFIKQDCMNSKVLQIELLDSEPARQLYNKYSSLNKTIY